MQCLLLEREQVEQEFVFLPLGGAARLHLRTLSTNARAISEFRTSGGPPVRWVVAGGALARAQFGIFIEIHRLQLKQLNTQYAACPMPCPAIAHLAAA